MSEEVILPGLRKNAMRRENAQQRSCTRSSAKDDEEDVGDGTGANKKGRRGGILSAPDG